MKTSVCMYSTQRLILFSLLSCTILISFAQENNGLWRTQGYGFAFLIDGEDATVFDVTSIGSIPSAEANISEDSFFLDGTYFGNFSLQDEQFVLERLDGNVFVLESADSLFNLITEDPQDPQLVFDILWQTHQEYSALLHILDLDWEQVRDTLRPQLTDSTDDETLFAVLEAMLEPLNDGHSVLADFENGNFFSGGPDASPYWEADGEGADLINAIALDYLAGDITITESDFIAYGPISDSIAYINVASMDGYAGDDDASAIEEDVAFREELTEAFEALKDQQALILDIRFNGGGSDQLARTLASYLTTERRLAYTKQAREGEMDQFLDSIAFYIEPQEVTYFEGKPIVVLTSNYTASAAEILTLCLNQIPNVSTLGEPTYGIFSDAIPKVLPNGWLFTYSPERYLSPEGTNYEQVGIPPNIEVMGDSALIVNGTDNILERALQELAGLTTSIQTAEFLQGSSRVFPNPIAESFQVDFTLPKASELSFELYDVQGRVLDIQSPERYGAGRHQLAWDTSQWETGIYFLRILSPDQSLSHTLMKQ